MGKNHLLSDYQEDCPMFSRIIPYLGELAEEIRREQGVIVDLGANVGDTVAALIKHTNAVVLCIEPTDEYYHLLNKNLFVMNTRERIRTIQAFISNKKRNYKAIVSGGGRLFSKNRLNQPYRHFRCRRYSLNVILRWIRLR